MPRQQPQAAARPAENGGTVTDAPVARVLSIDPSSTCMGYAVMTEAKALVDCGLLKPLRTRDPANARIETMVGEAVRLAQEMKPTRILIEDTSGKVGRRHRGNGAGLAVHGKSIGWLVGRLFPLGIPITLVPENDWTNGVQKARRQQIVAVAFRPQYQAAQDKGGDAADAIGLARWWFVQHFIASLYCNPVPSSVARAAGGAGEAE